ncbi:uncharacterized protein LOC135378798 isoform X1 [Ornithodoros turicata]|uniref:uncharacterized protein LOC135378798 isoform X1 n=1 Tax=Ornithodoros turicata TaxID=34597 RepID=UPI003139DB1C
MPKLVSHVKHTHKKRRCSICSASLHGICESILRQIRNASEGHHGTLQSLDVPYLMKILHHRGCSMDGWMDYNPDEAGKFKGTTGARHYHCWTKLRLNRKMPHRERACHSNCLTRKPGARGNFRTRLQKKVDLEVHVYGRAPLVEEACRPTLLFDSPWG